MLSGEKANHASETLTDVSPLSRVDFLAGLLPASHIYLEKKNWVAAVLPFSAFSVFPSPSGSGEILQAPLTANWCPGKTPIYRQGYLENFV